MFKLKLLILKTINKILKYLGRGTTLTGYLDTKLKFNILKNVDFTNKNILFVTGTNGKTSIINILNDILIKDKKTVLSNLAGANLETGIKTILIEAMDYSKNITEEYFVFEVDEKSVKHVAKFLKPTDVIITNFFRDQLDRYFEIELIIDEILEVVQENSTNLYFNVQDALLNAHIENLDVRKVGFKLLEDSESIKISNSLEEIKYCPHCQEKLKYNYYHYSHIGDFYCENCDFFQEKPLYTFENKDNKLYLNNKVYLKFAEKYPKYILLNLIAIIAFSEHERVTKSAIINGITKMKKIGGRNNIYSDDSKDIYLNLCKNVAGMEQTIQHIIKDNKDSKIRVLIAFNDNYADGRDVSWIWDVDYKPLIDRLEELYIVGTRKEDMKLRFLYDGFSKIITYDSIEEGLKKATENKVYIISNYTPLSRIRYYLEKKFK